MKRKLIPYKPYLKELARKLRNDSTLGEVLLWRELSNKKMYSFDFHRQKPLLNYIVDFYCYELDLVIEIDGFYHTHEEISATDKKREDELRQWGLIILRFREQDIRKDMVNVLRTIDAHIAGYIYEKN
ncbi:endonuclease domain-containing protein [Mucilaginibacter sp. HD30]